MEEYGMTVTVITLFIIYMAYWRRDTFLYIICCPVCIVSGLQVFNLSGEPWSLILALAYVAIGGYALILAILNVFEK